MGQPAARVGDMHTCPMVTPGTPPVPHVGGPIMPPGVPTVLIGSIPAATLGKMCTCVGPPDSILKGSMGVLIGGKPAARTGDNTAHGGVIVAGCPTVLIGDISIADIIAGVNAALSIINANGGTINCGNIIDGVAQFLNGEGLQTVTTERDGSWDKINERFGTNLDWDKPTSFKAIFKDLETRGPGSMTLVGIEYNDGSGASHVIVVANVSGVVGVMEGQGSGGFVTDVDQANSDYIANDKTEIVADEIPQP